MDMKYKAGLFMLFGLVLLAATTPHAAYAHEKNSTPCAIDVVFEDDEVGVATYLVLRLQHKNSTGRPIDAISVLVRNAAGDVIRNTDAVCGVGAEGLGAGSTGQCEKILQVITGKMSNKVGYDSWIEMIDDQRRQIGKADHCEVLGARYLDS